MVEDKILPLSSTISNLPLCISRFVFLLQTRRLECYKLTLYAVIDCISAPICPSNYCCKGFDLMPLPSDISYTYLQAHNTGCWPYINGIFLCLSICRNLYMRARRKILESNDARSLQQFRHRISGSSDY